MAEVTSSSLVGSTSEKAVLQVKKLLLVAVGDVQAGVNLDEMGEDDMRVEENRVAIDLPEARILSANLNEDETKLYARDRGLIDFRGDDTLIEEARRDTVDEIQNAAENNGIIAGANECRGQHRSLCSLAGLRGSYLHLREAPAVYILNFHAVEGALHSCLHRLERLPGYL